jgi:hypothetical protein
MGHQWNEIDRGKPTTRRKPCPSATLSTTNLTWTDPGSNPGLCGERPATNRLSHGTAECNLTAIVNVYLNNVYFITNITHYNVNGSVCDVAISIVITPCATEKLYNKPKTFINTVCSHRPIILHLHPFFHSFNHHSSRPSISPVTRPKSLQPSANPSTQPCLHQYVTHSLAQSLHI